MGILEGDTRSLDYGSCSVVVLEGLGLGHLRLVDSWSVELIQGLCFVKVQILFALFLHCS